MQDSSIKRYTIPSHVRWSVETHYLLLWAPSGNAQTIDYPQAAIWDFITRNYNVNDIIARLSIITNCTEHEMKKLYIESTNEWVRNGVLTLYT